MTEIRALLLTDVVDSTQLAERLGDQAMAALWAAHDRAARDLLVAWGGREIDKTDGMLLLFDSAADAVQYAVDYHRALAGLAMPLQARAGLHVGPVVLRENHPDDVARGAKPLEVDGLAKPVAARVMSVARGGQTLMTVAARQALDDFWLSRTKLQTRSHGHWMLKGISEPVELFEVGDDRARFTPPLDGEKVHRVVQVAGRWLPLSEVPTNLPEQRTSFVGRQRELAEIKALLDKTRLLTLLGMGGLGKTRLSLQVASEQLADFHDGVWFLDLAPLRDAALVVGELAQVLGVRDEPGQTPLQTLCGQIKSRRMLIILDNCEHLLRASAQLANALLKAAPKVVLIATSREALGVPGERTYPIHPLPVPARNEGFDELSRSAAVRMFVERAQAHRLDFEFNESLVPAMTELVARLEGIPLALELAAARVRSMSVADINRRLKHRYKVLTEGSVLLEERQQSLRALVDWSYDMLNDQEQVVLQRLAVFVGGFDLAAAEPVCGSDPVDPDDVMDLLASLVQKSLVTMSNADGNARYRMLETIRDYAAEKLADSGERAATAARHCEHFFALAKQARDGLQGPHQGEWLDRLETEQDNLRAALSLAQADDSGVDPFIAVKMAVALQNFWIMRGRASEGRAAVRATLARPAIQASDQAQAHALYVGAALAWVQSDLNEALSMLQSCLQLRRGLAKPVDVAATLSTLAVTKLGSGDAAGAAADGLEALQLFRDCGHAVGEAISLLQLGQIEAFLGNDAQALIHLQASRAIARRIKHPETEGEVELEIAELAWAAGNAEAAEQGFARSFEVCFAAGDRRGTANAEWALSRIDLLMGRLTAARERLAEALDAFDRFEMRGQWLGCLEDHAALALQLGERSVAVGLAAAAQRLRESAGSIRSPRARARWQGLLAQLRAAGSAEEFERDWQQGQEWDAEQLRGKARGLTQLLPAGG